MFTVTSHIAIPDSEIDIHAMRSQGAGGQNVNKVSSAIHLQFDIAASSLPPFYKEELLKLKDHLWSLAAALHGIRRVSTRQGWVGEKSGLFEHPARGSTVALDMRAIEFPPCHNSFSAARRLLVNSNSRMPSSHGLTLSVPP